MATHVSVDVPLLRQTGQRLAEISAVLHAAQTDGGRAAAAMAQRDLTAAMQDFESNWRIHRDQLIENIDAHQKLVVAAADAYQNLDAQMATALSNPTPAGGAK